MRKPNYIGGFFGNAGGGKSLSLAAVCVWEMIAGRKVWSNMKVKLSPNMIAERQSFEGSKLEYKETIPLDWNLIFMLEESLADGTVAIDEIGYFSDSMQSTTVKSRLINACIRQARHRRLNFFFTALDFGMLNYRLRYETDFIATCEDMSFKPWGKKNNIPGGICCLQRYYDNTGKMTGYRQDFLSGEARPYKAMEFHGRPYWDTYNSEDIVSLEEAFTGVELDLQKRRISNKEDTNVVQDKVFQSLMELKMAGNEKIPSDMLWAYLAKQGVNGSPMTLGRYIPRYVRRTYSRQVGELYDLSDLDIDVAGRKGFALNKHIEDTLPEEIGKL